MIAKGFLLLTVADFSELNYSNYSKVNFFTTLLFWGATVSFGCWKSSISPHLLAYLHR